MKILKTLRNYICYCGIEKDEYNALKKDAYVSNYRVWRLIHCLMVVIFGLLYAYSMIGNLTHENRPFYLCALIYSVLTTSAFFILKQDSLVAQLLIYLSISVLFLFSALITQNKPYFPATSFVAFLLITPMLMIDKPYFMAIELSAASAVFLIWMHSVKPYEIWRYDFVNVLIFMIVGIFLHIIANSIRIREFVLRRKINIQKDTDEMTGLKNKGALTREINEYLEDETTDRGILFIMDVDRFKAINDTYGHDVGDSVITQIGDYLGGRFTGDEIVGRFGGDEFIVFVKGTDDPDTAGRIAGELIAGVAESVSLPDKQQKLCVSIGAAVYHGEEKNYSEIFKKADVALYKSKSDSEKKFCIAE